MTFQEFAASWWQLKLKFSELKNDVPFTDIMKAALLLFLEGLFCRKTARNRILWLCDSSSSDRIHFQYTINPSNVVHIYKRIKLCRTHQICAHLIMILSVFSYQKYVMFRMNSIKSLHLSMTKTTVFCLFSS